MSDHTEVTGEQTSLLTKAMIIKFYLPIGARTLDRWDLVRAISKSRYCNRREGSLLASTNRQRLGRRPGKLTIRRNGVNAE